MWHFLFHHHKSNFKKNLSKKKKSSRILFLNIKKMLFFPFVKGKLKSTALWRLAQLQQIILTPVLLATPSVIFAAKYEACQQHKEIQPGRQLQSYIPILEKHFLDLAACALMLAKHTPGVATHVLVFTTEKQRKTGALCESQPEQWGTCCHSFFFF